MNDDMNALVNALKEQTEALKSVVGGQVQKAPANFETGFLLHGNGGIFSTPGLEREVISAHVRPYGIGAALPLIPTNSEDPRFASITGFSATIGAQPTHVCQDAPYGFMKGCELTARFAPLRFDTNTIDVTKVIRKRNRGEFTDLVLYGKLLGENNLKPQNMTEQDVLNVVTKAEMITVGVNFERTLSQWMWRGVLAAGQFPGLDVQIATGQMDASTSTLCPALDSDVKDFAYDLIGGTGRSIVEYVSMMEFYIRNNAETMGLTPVSWVWVMRPELWFELSAVWPCAYMSYRCSDPSPAANGPNRVNVINDNSNIAMRDAMRNGMYIDINGNRYPVMVDTGIQEETNINKANIPAGQYASSLYMVPLTISGNFPVTYREYLDFKLTGSDSELLKGFQAFWTDDGIYTWAIENNKWCFKLSGLTEQRVVLRTPQLAGKIQRIRYSPLQHLRESYPESAYFKDGGVSLRSSSFGHAVWS